MNYTLKVTKVLIGSVTNFWSRIF